MHCPYLLRLITFPGFTCPAQAVRLLALDSAGADARAGAGIANPSGLPGLPSQTIELILTMSTLCVNPRPPLGKGLTHWTSRQFQHTPILVSTAGGLPPKLARDQFFAFRQLARTDNQFSLGYVICQLLAHLLSRGTEYASGNFEKRLSSTAQRSAWRALSSSLPRLRRS
jgi:hypothetical protein